MHIAKTNQPDATHYAHDIPELFWLTGPASYGYQLGGRAVHDALVKESWLSTGSLFSHDAAHLATEDGLLLGMEVGFGTESSFRDRVEALADVWHPILQRGEIQPAQLDGLAERTSYCSWLNPTVPDNAYYLHAIAVVPTRRGEGIGAALLRSAIERARDSGLRQVQLDVLSDNPAVDLYRSFGFECLVESTAPIPLQFGVPTEYRMALELHQ